MRPFPECLDRCAGPWRIAHEIVYEYADLLGCFHSTLVQDLVGDRTSFAAFITGCIVDLFEKPLVNLGRLSEV